MDYKPAFFRKYILDGHTPVPEDDLIKWATWFENSGKERIVQITGFSTATISTVFLSLPHPWEIDDVTTLTT